MDILYFQGSFRPNKVPENGPSSLVQTMRE